MWLVCREVPNQKIQLVFSTLFVPPSNEVRPRHTLRTAQRRAVIESNEQASARRVDIIGMLFVLPVKGEKTGPNG